MKGYGFIEQDNGNDLFFHHSGLKENRHEIERGQAVKFGIGKNQRGQPIAVNIERAAGGIQAPIDKGAGVV